MTDPGPSANSLWELTVLCFLREGPMHPYELQRLVHERHTDDLIVLKRGSLYHAIDRLQRRGFIEAVGTTREGRRPERTTYRLTEEGEQELLGRLRHLIAVPQRETPVFMASVSFLLHLPPQEAVEHLEARAAVLEAEVTGMSTALEVLIPRVTRVNVLEVEYARALRQAELDWVRGIIRELREGRLTWDTEAILDAVRGLRPQPTAEKELET